MEFDAIMQHRDALDEILAFHRRLVERDMAEEDYDSLVHTIEKVWAYREEWNEFLAAQVAA